MTEDERHREQARPDRQLDFSLMRMVAKRRFATSGLGGVPPPLYQRLVQALSCPAITGFAMSDLQGLPCLAL